MNAMAIWLRYRLRKNITWEPIDHDQQHHLPEQPPPLKAVPAISIYYGEFKALRSISMPVYANRVTALIGPSGCGKSTYLRCFNRMHDLYPGHRYDGQIMLQPDNIDILDRAVDPIEVRMRVGMVFQKPNPFPKSIFEKRLGLRVRGEKSQGTWKKVEDALRARPVERGERPAGRGGGEPVRRAAAAAVHRGRSPPTGIVLSTSDVGARPIATGDIEELIGEIKHKVTI